MSMEIPQHRPVLAGGTTQQLLHEYVEASPRLRNFFREPGRASESVCSASTESGIHVALVA
jgi:hypothetical protein